MKSIALPNIASFGTLPRPARTQPAATQLKHANAKELANIKIPKEVGRRIISFGMKHSHSPKGKEARKEMNKLPAGSAVLTW